MRVEVKFVHLVAIFAKVYQCEQGGRIFAAKRFLPSDYFVIWLRNLAMAIYIMVLRGFMVFLLRMSNACAHM